METIFTQNNTPPNFKLEVAINEKSATYIGIALFVALLGALLVYKYLPKN